MSRRIGTNTSFSSAVLTNSNAGTMAGSSFTWAGSRHLMVRAGKKIADRMANEVDVVGLDDGKTVRLEFPVAIEDFSASADGTVVVFSTFASPEDGVSVAQAEQQVRELRGYPILFGKGSDKASERPLRV